MAANLQPAEYRLSLKGEINTMVSALVLCTAAVSGMILQPKVVEEWPKMSRKELPSTALVVHELKGTGYVVRQGVTYVISGFETKARQAKKMLPHRLAILDQDQFWLGRGSFAKISYPGVTRTTDKLITFGRDHREEGRRYWKNKTPLSPAEIYSLRLLVHLGQNSKPLTDTSEPQILLPQKDEVIPSTGLKAVLWPMSETGWSKLYIVYPLSSGHLPISDSYALSDRITVSRKLALSKLADFYGSADEWQNKEIGLRLIALNGVGRTFYQDFYLATPAQDEQIAGLLRKIIDCLQKKASPERDIELFELCGQLSDHPSVLIEALAKHKNDPAALSAMELIFEDLAIPAHMLLSP